MDKIWKKWSLITLLPNQTRIKTYLSNTLSSDKIHHYRVKFFNGELKKLLVRVEQLACTDCTVGDWLYEYDNNGYVSKSTSPTGLITTYVYDTNGNETQRKEAVGTTEERLISSNWRQYYFNGGYNVRKLYYRIQDQFKTTYYYNNGTFLMRTKEELDFNTYERRYTAYTYTSDGLITSVDGPRTDVSDKTTYAYDSDGNLSTVTNALGHVTTFGNYDDNGRVGQITDANGIITTFNYTPRGWLSSSSFNGALTTFDYFSTGSVKSVSLPNGMVLNYEYDDGERLIAVEDNQNNRMEFTLNLMGNIERTQVKDANGVLKQNQQLVFNALGQLKQSLGNQGQSIELDYDAEGNTTTETNALNNTTTSNFDALNRLKQVIDAQQGETQYTYDQLDRITSISDAEGKTTSYEYNAFSELIKQISPDTGTTTFTYDKAGNRLTKTDARGITVSYTYDALNRVKTESYPDSTENKVYTYDNTNNNNKAIGRLTRVTDQSGSTDYIYNGFGQVTQQSQNINGHIYLVEYHYNSNGQITGMTYPGGRRVTYIYDNLGRVSSFTTTYQNQTKSLATNIDYLPFGPISGLTYGNGKTLTLNYDLDYRLTDNQVSGIHNLSYSYDVTNNITQIQDNQINTSYVYDTLSRLTSTTGDYGNLSFTYDKIGNRLNKTENNNTDSYIYAETSHWLTSITGSNPFSFTYDAVGNRLTKNELTFTYNDQGRMESAAKPGVNVNYLYNFQGQRVLKLVNGVQTHFIFDINGQLIAEAGDQGNIIKQYIYAYSQPFAQISNNNIYYYHNDHLGTPKVITDESQTVVWQASHLPFGLANITTNTIENNIRFPGQYFDVETNLHYNYFRDYDPSIGRYIQSDPIGLNGGINTYGYAYQNPIRYIDPTGEIPLAIPLIVGAIATTAVMSHAISYAINPYYRRNFDQAAREFGQAFDRMFSSTSQSDAAARKDAQWERYHNVCDEPPPPPSGDPCADAKRKRKQAQRCYDLRKNYSDKWDVPGSRVWEKHRRQLAQVKNRIINAVDEIKEHCSQECL